MGIFTLAGNHHCETTIEKDLNLISQLVLSEIGPEVLSAILLFGGYGRGEGGVQELNGKLQPHNNYDILLITKSFPLRRNRGLFKTIMKIKSLLLSSLVVDVDFSFMTEKEIRNSRFRLLLCDTKHASKVLWGNKNILDLLPKMKLDQVPLIEGLWLLLNRSTLLLINQIELSPKRLNFDSNDKKKFLRHIAKAIIGTGDSVLIGLGKYHWSYLEKLRRLEELDNSHNVPIPNLAKFYRFALEWRLTPQIKKWNSEEILNQQKTAWSLSQSCYLWLEKLRMDNPNLTWDNYLQNFSQDFPRLLQAYSDTTPKKLLFRKLYPLGLLAYGSLAGIKTFGWRSLTVGMPWAFLSPRDRLLVIFPHLAFSPHPPIEFLGHLIGGKPQSYHDLACSYLHAWKKFCA